VFGLFKKKNKQQPIELSPQQDEFLASAIEYHNRNNKILNRQWGFESLAEWGFDQETGIFFIRHEDGSRVEGRGQLYGSYSESDGTWEWAWNNPMVEEAMSIDSRKAKEYGEEQNLTYLILGVVPVSDEMSATYLASIVEKLADAQGVYSADAGAIKVFIGLKELKRISQQSSPLDADKSAPRDS